MDDSQHSFSRGEHYLVAAGFIHSQGLALVARRALSKSIAPGQLHLPGGHAEGREQPAAALRREIAEEFGVQVQVGDPLHVFAYDVSGHYTIGIVFAAALIGPRSALHLNPSDHTEILWVDRDALDELFPDKANHNYVGAIKGFAYLSDH